MDFKVKFPGRKKGLYVASYSAVQQQTFQVADTIAKHAVPDSTPPNPTPSTQGESTSQQRRLSQNAQSEQHTIYGQFTG